MNRRNLLATVGALVLAGCDKLSQSPGATRTVSKAEGLNLKAQRALIGRHALAREFTRADISKDFKANGTIVPHDADYKALMDSQFAAWSHGRSRPS